MKISILANNPLFIEKNQFLIKQYVHDSDIFVSFKFKYIGLIKDADLKKHHIYFRTNRNGDFIYGFNDYKDIMKDLIRSNQLFYLIGNINYSVKNSISAKIPGIIFQPFDQIPIINFLLGYEGHEIFEKIGKLLYFNEKIDTNKISTGFLTILYYYIKHPNSDINLLGFFENQISLTEGMRITSTVHNYPDEKSILKTVAPNLIFLN